MSMKAKPMARRAAIACLVLSGCAGGQCAGEDDVAAQEGEAAEHDDEGAKSAEARSDAGEEPGEESAAADDGGDGDSECAGHRIAEDELPSGAVAGFETSFASGLALAPNGDRVAYRRPLCVHDIDGAVAFEGTSSTFGQGFAGEGDILFKVSQGGDGGYVVSLIDLEADQEIAEVEIGGGAPYHLAASSDGESVAIGSEEVLLVTDAEGNELARAEYDDPYRYGGPLAVSRDGGHVIVMGSEGTRRFDIENAEFTGTFDYSTSIFEDGQDRAVTSDGEQVAERVHSTYRSLTSDDMEDTTIDMLTVDDESRSELTISPNHYFRAMAMSPDGQLLVTGGWPHGDADPEVLLWDIESEELIAEVGAHPAEGEGELGISHLSVSRDGTRVVSSDAGRVYVWDLEY